MMAVVRIGVAEITVQFIMSDVSDIVEGEHPSEGTNCTIIWIADEKCLPTNQMSAKS